MKYQVFYGDKNQKSRTFDSASKASDFCIEAREQYEREVRVYAIERLTIGQLTCAAAVERNHGGKA